MILPRASSACASLPPRRAGIRASSSSAASAPSRSPTSRCPGRRSSRPYDGAAAPEGVDERGTGAMRTASEVPLRYNAVDILERNLGSRGDKVALHGPDRAMTFRQVSREANQVAGALSRQLDVRLGGFVALLCLDQPEWVTAFFGILKAGAAAVSINTMATQRECAYILGDCRARVLFVHEALLPTVEQI